MERLTERKRNFNGTAISKKSMIDREGYPTVSDYASKVLTKLADYEDAEEQGLLLPEPYQGSESHKQTNADEIRSMTDEELADFIINFDNHFGEEYEGEQSCLAWLQKESEEQ